MPQTKSNNKIKELRLFQLLHYYS